MKRTWSSQSRVRRPADGAGDDAALYEEGTIVAAVRSIKVKWDGGATSYFRRRLPANIRVVGLT